MADAMVFLGKAEESLASAGDDLAGGRYNACARNSYFAAFQAGVAALINEGVISTGQWTHKFVHARFAGVLINSRKVYSSKQRNTLADMQKLRSRADYGGTLTSNRSAKQAFDAARNMVAGVRRRINGGS
jgi:uncharacterized protein (UPF0332 family)